MKRNETRTEPPGPAALARPVALPGPGQAVLPPSMALSLQEGICVFYDLELAQIHILQEEGQEKSAESKVTEKPPDTLLMEVKVLDKVKLEIWCSILS